MGAGASQGLIARLDELAARPGYQLVYSVAGIWGRERAAITRVPEGAWQVAIDHHGQLQERRTEDACPNPRCAHARCWRKAAHVIELTGLLRKSPGGDQLAGWPPSMRIFARRERPPGRPAEPVRSRRRLAVFPVGDQSACQPAGLARQPLLTSTPPTGCMAGSRTPVRAGKDTGIGHFPSHDFAINFA
jgi:hypothetical protein